MITYLLGIFRGRGDPPWKMWSVPRDSRGCLAMEKRRLQAQQTGIKSQLSHCLLQG